MSTSSPGHQRARADISPRGAAPRPPIMLRYVVRRLPRDVRRFAEGGLRSDSVTGPPVASALARMLDGTRNTRPGDAGHGNVLRPTTFPLCVAITVGIPTGETVHSNNGGRAGGG